jgi:hypothetical protein
VLIKASRRAGSKVFVVSRSFDGFRDGSGRRIVIVRIGGRAGAARFCFTGIVHARRKRRHKRAGKPILSTTDTPRSSKYKSSKYKKSRGESEGEQVLVLCYSSGN